jgi:hypothetical protein
MFNINWQLYRVKIIIKFKFKNMYNPNYSDRAIPLVAVNENTGSNKFF